MATHDRRFERSDHLGDAPRQVIRDPRRGTVGRYRARAASHTRARLISSRHRRVLARWLRRTAAHVHEPHPLVRRRETLLHDRVAAVRTDLLEIAAMLECAQHPDPAHVAELHDLLANGCDSPLYNSDIHISELYATLDYVRDGLA
jgi:hypothetical protein